MPSGNGAKAAQRRERASKDAPKEAKSQLELNKKSMNIQCALCKQPFMCTTKPPTLQEHIDSKHPKSTAAVCFPGVAF